MIDRTMTSRARWQRRLRGLLVAAMVWGATAVAGGQEANQTLEQRRAELLLQRAKQKDLHAAAYGADFDKAVAAIAELSGGEQSQQAAARAALLKWLRSDRAGIHRALQTVGNADALARHINKLAELQKAALANIQALEKGDDTLPLAHRYYKDLQAGYKPLAAYYPQVNEIMTRMSRRPQLLELWAALKTPRDTAFGETDEQELRQRAEEALGMSMDDARRIIASGIEYPVADGDLFKNMLVRYVGCRQIERYNERAMAGFMDREELANARLVNQYRETLGLWRLEWDARLIQAARRHSKSMVDRGFFSHTSPVPGDTSPPQRMTNAGYERAGGENIAMGSTSGEKTFWQWFDSPGHHRNMVREYEALGVGRWNDHHTQNFGRGARLMLLPPEERAKIAIVGDILGPGR